MTGGQRQAAALTGLDAALALLLAELAPVAPIDLDVADALGSIAAAMPPLAAALPARSIAMTDGFALRAVDLAGASSYTPVPLSAPPVWVEAGDVLPEGCDCVLDAGAIEQAGPLTQAVADAIPGAGVRRVGEDLPAGGHALVAGRRIGVVDEMIARRAGQGEVSVRRPRVRIIDVPATRGNATTIGLVAAQLRGAGAQLDRTVAAGRDAASVSKAIAGADCDLLITVGGTGAGRNDAAVAALAAHATLIHGLALQPGRTAAAGRIGTMPVVAVPGAPDQALAVWWTLVQPVLDRLSGRLPRRAAVKPLLRKIASTVGMTDLVLLQDAGEGWLPLAVGDLPLRALAAADAWLAVPAHSEGFATGTPVGGSPLREGV
ncbi:molybdopterin-binding protein [Bradyrhizobium sp. U87765 SZCCT0131]|uniref:molybdopterin-binding protein n=1 Tax=unclassified Bradyrhizobium TaxID=2631580 RepID=UPI001BA745A9|nr:MULTISPECIES: molybdopterin-binding protein [unclassified Bradyrhizobium]MBR1219528.1 molybdopterin-binding protein [Bradyrhizobium sp. U87765 SZCCT0131]MBR1262179.1 molybdopterin-binding protein [Bradyrhizobium sp. U87765 SZCCT0134]MBR1308638.1 molybdopterin-binding protein [Bradyrhizobium sp. U87765 SZCCT0110]MBR1317961.1 molybdopterin-binding protein [Bradyrhizobium sp. U87765 SZCCT0109]MBR1351664.1 molybdopterin-binding protein [Bradyrhizobium sp. U87765 SZCCT0048]